MKKTLAKIALYIILALVASLLIWWFYVEPIGSNTDISELSFLEGFCLTSVVTAVIFLVYGAVTGIGLLIDWLVDQLDKG